jgi:hypothetical protein
LSILAFWLATTGWLLWHELWPSWLPDAPPYHIDLVDEVVQKGSPLKTPWTVLRRSKSASSSEASPVFRASTWVEYQRDEDTFTLHAVLQARKDLTAQPFYLGVGPLKVKVEELTSAYRVDRAGRLRELRTEVKVQPRNSNSPALLQAQLWAEVRGEQLFAHCRGRDLESDQRIEIDLPPAPVSYNGSVLLPLHPVNRIHGLRPGRSWRQPLLDPFRDVFPSVPGFGGGVRQVNARVLPQPQVLELAPQVQPTCLVIEYESEGEILGRTWVEQDSERVQQQEAVLDGDTWIMKRDVLTKRLR